MFESRYLSLRSAGILGDEGQQPDAFAVGVSRENDEGAA